MRRSFLFSSSGATKMQSIHRLLRRRCRGGRQESTLAPVFSAYQGARNRRLREQARSRGVWPIGKGAGKAKAGTSTRRAVPDVAKESARARWLREFLPRLAGWGRWKRECPRNVDNQPGPSKIEVSNLPMEGNDNDSGEDSEPPREFLQELLEDASMYIEDLEIDDHEARHPKRQAGGRIQSFDSCCFASLEVKPSTCVAEGAWIRVEVVQVSAPLLIPVVCLKKLMRSSMSGRVLLR